MRDRRRLRLFRLADLYRNNALLLRLGHTRKLFQGGDVSDTFDVQAQRCDARVFQKGPSQISDPKLRLIARGCDIRQRQTTFLHGQINRQVRALRDEGNAAIDRNPSVLIRPKHRAIQIVDKAITIRPNDRHLSRR